MKIIIVGGTGTLGSAIVEELKPRHEVLVAGRNSGDLQVDTSSTDSIKAMYQSVNSFDALINAAGDIPFKPIVEIIDTDYREGIDGKLMSQINLVLLGLDYINEKGSFTLTSGILNRNPIVMGSVAALVNAGVEGFVTSASIEMLREIRLNVVSPTLLTESVPLFGEYFPGFVSVPAAKVALSYAKSVEGKLNGEIFKVFE